MPRRSRSPGVPPRWPNRRPGTPREPRRHRRRTPTLPAAGPDPHPRSRSARAKPTPIPAADDLLEMFEAEHRRVRPRPPKRPPPSRRPQRRPPRRPRPRARPTTTPRPPLRTRVAPPTARILRRDRSDGDDDRLFDAGGKVDRDAINRHHEDPSRRRRARAASASSSPGISRSGSIDIWSIESPS